jgi:nitrile hydratase
MHGFGSVPIEADEAVFHEPWEGRVWAMTLSLVRRTTIDRFRYTIEQMPPGEYLTSGYYNRWLWAAERLGHDEGLTSGEGPMAGRPRPSPAAPPGKGVFAPGERVRVRNVVTAAHNRVPRYLRRAEGVVQRAAFRWPNPTESATTGVYGEPEVVYTVTFAATDLFGPEADHTIAADLSESDLEKP